MTFEGYEYIEVERIVHETQKAFLVKIEEGTHWIPKSQVADSESYESGDENVTLAITSFIAEKLGLA